MLESLPRTNGIALVKGVPEKTHTPCFRAVIYGVFRNAAKVNFLEENNEQCEEAQMDRSSNGRN